MRILLTFIKVHKLGAIVSNLHIFAIFSLRKVSNVRTRRLLQARKHFVAKRILTA